MSKMPQKRTRENPKPTLIEIKALVRVNRRKTNLKCTLTTRLYLYHVYTIFNFNALYSCIGDTKQFELEMGNDALGIVEL